VMSVDELTKLQLGEGKLREERLVIDVKGELSEVNKEINSLVTMLDECLSMCFSLCLQNVFQLFLKF
jgi:hypothetical protein